MSMAAYHDSTATLHVIKHVINDNGEIAVAGMFNIHVTTSGSDVVGSPAPGVESPGTTYTLTPGTYVVSEDGYDTLAYGVSYSGDFDFIGGNIVTLNPGDVKTVTIINDDLVNEGIQLATLHVIKHVINDSGGTEVAGSFNLHVKSISGNDVVGSPAPGVESPGTTYTLGKGTYKVSEDAFAGYTVSYSGDIDANGNITLNPGDNKTVTITNDDDLIQPPSEATLHVIKHVINDSGGTEVAGSFNLHVKSISGNDVVGSPAPGVESPGTTYTLGKGTYKVSEDAFAGYTVSYSGDIDANGNITLNPGDNKTVTITNDDDLIQPPTPEETPAPIKVTDTLDFAYGYINGYTNGNVGFKDSLTREQVSASLYRIFKQAGKIIGYTKPAVSDFTDLATDRWSYATVEYMVSIGAIPKGATVNPLEPITRGEMAKIIAISNNMTNNRSVIKFTDLPESHMYYDYINMIVNYGLVVGYPDGKFKPDGLITRAEYITIINKFIGRDNRYYVDGLPSIYKDLLPSHWAFADIQRASFGFTTTVDINGLFQVDPAMGISKASLDN
ncbi:MAG: S-layer homology domain-containing protein [Paenibacillaceae bacterium]